MFEALTDKLHSALRKLRGVSELSEKNIAEAMNDVRSALLDADVNMAVADDFIESIKKSCLGEEVIKSVTPGQMAVKIVYDNLVRFLGEEAAPLNWNPDARPNIIVMCGLHGSGKTTTSAKLGVFLKKQNRKTLLAACDVYRPAAIEQLEILGFENQIEVYSERNNMNVSSIAQNAIARAKAERFDYVIIDTAGRLQIDTEMIDELKRLKADVNPQEILLVADAALGQQAASVAEHFNDAMGITGVILTKLDGDARGGAALSIRSITGRPIKFAGTGEKSGDLDTFHPDRMASRILGMGDIISLVEKAAADMDAEEAKKMAERLKKNKFDFDDFLSQIRQLKKLGGLESVLKFLPGGEKLLNSAIFDSKDFVRIEAMILSMTKKERSHPELIDFSRRKRIARGSGSSQEQVSGLIKRFTEMRKFMRSSGLFSRLLGGGGGGDAAFDTLGSMMDSFGSGGMPGMQPGFRMPSFKRGSNYTPPKKKKKR